jgi:hypothetical protein
MENTYINLEHMESSAVGDSKKGFCSEVLQTGAAGRTQLNKEWVRLL